MDLLEESVQGHMSSDELRQNAGGATQKTGKEAQELVIGELGSWG